MEAWRRGQYDVIHDRVRVKGRMRAVWLTWHREPSGWRLVGQHDSFTEAKRATGWQPGEAALERHGMQYYDPEADALNGGGMAPWKRTILRPNARPRHNASMLEYARTPRHNGRVTKAAIVAELARRGPQTSNELADHLGVFPRGGSDRGSAAFRDFDRQLYAMVLRSEIRKTGHSAEHDEPGDVYSVPRASRARHNVSRATPTAPMDAVRLLHPHASARVTKGGRTIGVRGALYQTALGWTLTDERRGGAVRFPAPGVEIEVYTKAGGSPVVQYEGLDRII
jgi:hypothetical protein